MDNFHQTIKLLLTEFTRNLCKGYLLDYNAKGFQGSLVFTFHNINNVIISFDEIISYGQSPRDGSPNIKNDSDHVHNEDEGYSVNVKEECEEHLVEITEDSLSSMLMEPISTETIQEPPPHSSTDTHPVMCQHLNKKAGFVGEHNNSEGVHSGDKSLASDQEIPNQEHTCGIGSDHDSNVGVSEEYRYQVQQQSTCDIDSTSVHSPPYTSHINQLSSHESDSSYEFDSSCIAPQNEVLHFQQMAFVRGRYTDPVLQQLLDLRIDKEDQWSEKAVISLVKKLKRQKQALVNLVQALTSPETPSQCVTIPRASDGRVQVGVRKGYPQIVYCRIWRWLDIRWLSDIKSASCCKYPHNQHRDRQDVCINPYHYTRVVHAVERRYSDSPHVDAREEYKQIASEIMTTPCKTPDIDVKRLLKWKVDECSFTWQERAVSSLVKKLRNDKDALGNLEHALRSSDEHSKCVTIPRSRDGRMQVGSDKSYAHIMYCRIWRWSDVKSPTDIKSLEHCRYPFNAAKEEVCINPYHYAKTTLVIRSFGKEMQSQSQSRLYTAMEDDDEAIMPEQPGITNYLTDEAMVLSEPVSGEGTKGSTSKLQSEADIPRPAYTEDIADDATGKINYYKCNTCVKTFRQKSLLLRHVEMHTQEQYKYQFTKF